MTPPPRKGLSLSVSLSDKSTPIGENVNGGLSMNCCCCDREGEATLVAVVLVSPSVRAVAVGDAASVSVPIDDALRGDGEDGDDALPLPTLLPEDDDDLLLERDGLELLLLDDESDEGEVVELEDDDRCIEPRADKVGELEILRLGGPKLSACPLILRVGDDGTRLNVRLERELLPSSIPLRRERVGLRRLAESILPTFARKASDTPMGGSEGECSLLGLKKLSSGTGSKLPSCTSYGDRRSS